jgi:CheY-like chemotaxis protein
LTFSIASNDGESILLFLDINMPVMDGWGLLDIIHEADFDKIEIIMVTSSVDQGDKDKGLVFKIIDFLENHLVKKI